MENALVIFVRNPEKGKVKTRLSRDLGDDKTLQVYKYLLQYTRDVSVSCNCSHFVFYSSYVHLNDVFDDYQFTKFVQDGIDLGERMMNAFKKVFEMGCKKVCIVGSDCHELEPEIINEAFVRLELNDVVFGPAKDGGYYLLGMTQIIPELFTQKDWGTSAVLDESIDALTKQKIAFSLLPKLNDIDTLEDLLETNILTHLKEIDTKD